MTTTQIIISACGFFILICVSLVVYIFKDTKKIITTAVTEKSCQERRETEAKELGRVCDKLSKHRHTDDGKVEVEI